MKVYNPKFRKTPQHFCLGRKKPSVSWVSPVMVGWDGFYFGQFTVSDKAVSRFLLRRCSFREFHLGVMSGILCRFSLANVVSQELP